MKAMKRCAVAVKSAAGRGFLHLAVFHAHAAKVKEPLAMAVRNFHGAKGENAAVRASAKPAASHIPKV